MTIFVDGLRTYPLTMIQREARWYGKLWCHMTTDGPIEELHAFAAMIGMKRRWFQEHPRHPHYDLVPGRRQRAIAQGAREKV